MLSLVSNDSHCMIILSFLAVFSSALSPVKNFISLKFYSRKYYDGCKVCNRFEFERVKAIKGYLGIIPKTPQRYFYSADLHGCMEVINELCVPHFYHALLN